jgi:hypothetical protein
MRWTLALAIVTAVTGATVALALPVHAPKLTGQSLILKTHGCHSNCLWEGGACHRHSQLGPSMCFYVPCDRYICEHSGLRRHHSIKPNH